MPREIRFAAFVREITVHQWEIDYDELVPTVETDAAGVPIPYRPPKLKLRPLDVYRIVQPYVGVRFIEQVKAVVPLTVYLVLFQILILRQSVVDSWIITGGLLSVMIGLMPFIEGLKMGLMPLGETIGNTLPAKSSLFVVLVIVFLLGIGVTFAEPAIGALKAAGAIIQIERAPYLYTLLNDWADVLVLVVGAGVGLAAVLRTVRFLYGWSLGPFIYLTLVPTIGLTAYIMFDPDLSKMLGLAWDCGAVNTGPVTVPLMLSLGVGIAAAAGKGDTSLSGFGIVTLASLFPITAVLGRPSSRAPCPSPPRVWSRRKRGRSWTTLDVHVPLRLAGHHTRGHGGRSTSRRSSHPRPSSRAPCPSPPRVWSFPGTSERRSSRSSSACAPSCRWCSSCWPC